MEKFLAQYMPVDASQHGHEIDRLIAWVHWLMLILFIVWGAYFIFVLWRFNARKQPRSRYAGAETHLHSYGEAGVAIIEVVLLVGFSIPMWYRWTTPPTKAQNPLEIRAVA